MIERQHTSASVGRVEAHLLVPAHDAPLADVEAAIKAVARLAISAARAKHSITPSYEVLP